MTKEPPRKPRLPKILGGVAFALTILVLGPIGYAVVSLSSHPGGSGADPAAKLLVALLVLAVAATAGLIVQGLAALILRLASRS